MYSIHVKIRFSSFCFDCLKNKCEFPVRGVLRLIYKFNLTSVKTLSYYLGKNQRKDFVFFSIKVSS